MGGALESGFGGGVLLGAKLLVVSENSAFKFELLDVGGSSGEFLAAFGRGMLCFVGNDMPKVGE